MLDTAEKRSNRLARDLADHVENREFRRGHANPERQSLIFVIVVETIKFPKERFKLACVLPLEKRNDPIQEDRVEMNHVHRVGNGHPFRAVGRSHPDEKLVIVAKEFHRGDLQRLANSLDLKNGLGRDPIHPFEPIGLRVTRQRPPFDPPSQTKGNRGPENCPASYFHDRSPGLDVPEGNRKEESDFPFLADGL